MRSISSSVLAVVVVVIIGGGIGLSAALGYWQTESDRVPSRFETGEYAGLFDPADIRGSYTMGDVADSFEIPLDVLASAFGISSLSEPEQFTASTLESIFLAQPDGGEVGTDALRLFVSLYAGLPYLPEETTRLPEPAFAILGERLSPADRALLELRIVPMPALLPPDQNLEALLAAADEEHETEEGDESALADTEIRGRTTFGDLLTWGLTREQIEEVIGMEMPVRASNVRDTLSEAGLEFGIYRDALQQLLDEGATGVGE
jgi:hypothetical protein